MNEHYVVKDLFTNKYYSDLGEFDDDIIAAKWFESEDDALKLISSLEGIFNIIKIYRP